MELRLKVSLCNLTAFMPIAPGTVLGRYEIRSPLGVGGMGEVYLAFDSQLARTVALKVLPQEIAGNAERMQRFVQEARSASALNHPNILTIYEIGETNSISFIATEFVDGETLRQRMGKGQLPLAEVLEIAIQVSSALAKAHQAGIIHRDIKPENVMLNRDGYVKLLDFGLAKYAPRSAADTEAPTRALIHTEPGTVMGTTRYMSPEQARGLGVDARTDIWSLGVMLYEMVTAHLPFQGQTPSDLIVSILQSEPPPITRFAEDVPEQFGRIVRKALAKNSDERYQSVKDLLIDLKNLKRELELEAELDRTVSPEARPSRVSTYSSAGTDEKRPAKTMVESPTPTGASYVINEIKRHRTVALVSAGVVLLAIIAFTVLYTKRTPALTERDTILIADFVNTTGDQMFDGTLKQALAVQLGQSPYLNIFPEERIRETLRFMGRSSDERVTRDVAREICQRQGVKALLASSISSLGANYVITIEAINARSGEAIAREQVEVGSKEQVIKGIGDIASRLREKLGESLVSVRKFDAPIEQATTSSLEAFKAFALGDEKRAAGNYQEALPFYRRAVDLDPQFAIAYARLAVMYFNLGQIEAAEEFAVKAFELRERVSERERLYIETRYYETVVGDLERAIEVMGLWKQSYPRDFVPHNNLAVVHMTLGQPEQAISSAREAIERSPKSTSGYVNLTAAYIDLERYDEAKAVIEQATAQGIDTPIFQMLLFRMAVMQNDTATMQQKTDWFAGQPLEFFFVNQRSAIASQKGKLKEAEELSQRSITLARRHNPEAVHVFTVIAALRDASFGRCARTRAEVKEVLQQRRNRETLTLAALSYAICNEPEQAQAIVKELSSNYPQDTVINQVWLPAVRAMTELRANRPQQAVEILRTESRYEAGGAGGYWPTYVRGLAFLQQGMGQEAAAEFRKILTKPRVGGSGPFIAMPYIYPFAQLGLARAAAIAGDNGTSRRAYQDLFATWKDADSDLELLQQAREEYERLK